MIGDSDSDRLAGERLGMTTVQLRGAGLDLGAAVELLLSGAAEI